jgi:hypothetical protein
MAKGSNVSKNAKTARKKLVLTYKGQKVKLVICMRNILGTIFGNDGTKVPAGRFKAVQLENGALLQDSCGNFVAWDDIASEIVEA